MNQKSKQVLSQAQQDKLRQLRSEIDVLENQIENILQEQTQLVGCCNSRSERSAVRGNAYQDKPCRLTAGYSSPIYISDRFAQTGIRLAHDIDS